MAYSAPDVYFAADVPEKLVERLSKRAATYRDWLSSTGRASRMERAWSAYYGGSVDGLKDAAGLLTGGEQGELTLATANLFGVVVRQVMRLITGQKPAFKVVAKTSDAKSMAQAMLGDSLLESYDRAAHLTESEVDAVQSGMLLGSGFVALSWSTALGEEIGLNPDTDKIIREGDVSVRTLTPWDVVHDVTDTPETRQWILMRAPAKRFDLVAQFPELADKIRQTSGDLFAEKAGPTDNLFRLAHSPGIETDGEDNVTVWEFRHLATPALPGGRLVRFVSKDCVLYDSASVPMQGEVGEDGLPQPAQGNAGYPYPGLLVEEYFPERRAGRRSETHSPQWDALSMQEGLDVVMTALTTNANIGALVNLWAAPGSAPNIQRLDSGLNLVESATKPEVLSLLSLPPELMGLGELFQDFMQQISGLNDVVMGDTPSGMPAQLAALLEAKAVQFHQQGQAGYYRLVEGVRTGCLKLLQKFSKGPRVALLAGKANQWALREWTADEISSLDRVRVEPVNPVMRTFAGRITFADSLAEKFPQSMTLEKYTGVWLTGELAGEMDPLKARLVRIAQEKEMLMRGIGMPPVDIQQSMLTGSPVFVDDGQEHIRPIAFDKHWLDIPEYLSVLESQQARSDAAVVQAVLDLVQEKMRLWQQMPMDILLLLGGQPAPSTMLPPPGMPMAPPPEGESKGAPKAAAIAGEASPDVSLPAPPPNPVTGEAAPPPVQSPTLA